MLIAPNFRAKEWRVLQLDDSASSDWDIAIAALNNRIRQRYVEPVDFLIAAEREVKPVERKYGFTVLAIDCLLIETLGAFIEGLEDTNGLSRKTFCNFLTTQPQFTAEFPRDLAEQFYSEFRCGVLHQAELGGNSKVWSVGPLIQCMGDGSIIVNRNKFHEKLKAAFDAYLLALSDPTNHLLRSNFRKKMNFISRL